MADEVTVQEEGLVGSVGFTRQVNDGNYGSATFFANVQYSIADALKDTVEARDKAIAAAKSVVLEGLSEYGITFEVEGTMVTENFNAVATPKASPSEAAAIITAATGATATAVVSGVPATKVAGKDQDWVAANPLPEWFTNEYVASQDGDVNETYWDNRKGAQGTKRPHFKGMKSEKALWPPRD